eukprot:TRINITY_DN43031_c0_g1_i5.p1 TRINITY_DN43031_c0_g1~~TRINITY_DN43031_c0_g1_i5.p1  ORF type:complete len:271 (+),score=39.38 TRINITY_DN43031_c0_g1_i5:46-858(+)
MKYHRVLRRGMSSLSPTAGMPRHGDMQQKLTTTLMIQNLPSRCEREDVLNAMNQLGFQDSYDFFHLPVRNLRLKSQNFGYAFVNFLDPLVAQRFSEAVNNGSMQIRNKCVSAVPAHIQGVVDLREHFESRGVEGPAAPIFRDQRRSASSPQPPTTLRVPSPELSPDNDLARLEPAVREARTPPSPSSPSPAKPVLGMDEERISMDRLPQAAGAASSSHGPAYCQVLDELPMPMKVPISSSEALVPIKIEASDWLLSRCVVNAEPVKSRLR